MKFINRKSELKKLRDLWNEDSANLAIIYGKRRVGKTELIKHFLQNGRGIYFLADKRTHKEQLIEFARVVGNFFNDGFLNQNGFENWIEAFRYLAQKAKSQKFAVAIDEFPYLSETDPATSSIFQKIWDEYVKDSGIFLILCGSSIALMESEALSYKAPLYGRYTARLLIEPMDYRSSMKFFPHLNFNEFVSFYSVTGGMPAYMQLFSKYNKLNEALNELCWDKQGLYYNEVNNMLKQELRVPNSYFAILKAIAMGETQVGKIASHTGLEGTLVNKYLDVLMRLQFVRKEVPVTEEKPHKSRKGIYLLSESFVRFWFQYVYSFSSDLEIGLKRDVDRRFAKHFNEFEANTFEQLSRDFLHKNSEKIFKFSFEKFGRHWDSNVEIDGMGINYSQKKLVLLEAKWSNQILQEKDLEKLYAKGESLKMFKDFEKYYVFSNRAGYKKSLMERAVESGGKLLLFENLKRVTQDDYVNSL